jgi:hypothetical protein
MLLRSILAIAGVCAVFTLWAIAVSADDAKQARVGTRHIPSAEHGVNQSGSDQRMRRGFI